MSLATSLYDALTRINAIRADIATVRTEIATLRSEMKALTFDITTRMGLLYVTATSFLLAVLKFT